MDVFFAREAALFLQALPLAGLNPGSGGLLIGHKRGQRFIVEKIFPAQKAFFLSLDHYFRLNDLFEGKIIGFFSFGLDKANIQKILKPFACGKLYLEIRPNRKETLNMRPYVIEYSKSFFLQRIHLHPQPKEAK